jgi:hypothetical protein
MSTLGQEFECTIEEAAILLEILTDAGDPVMIHGAPGLGKSDIVRQLGARKKRKVIDIRLNLREPVDLRGIPMPDVATGTTKWMVPDELPQAERDGAEGYLFLDEINTASQQMMAAAFGLVLDRKVGEYTLVDGWVIIAAGNRVADKASAQRMPTALRNRFAHIIVVPDVAAFCTWANVSGVAPELIAFQRLRSGENGGKGILHVMPKGDENAFPTPRSWTKAAKFVGAPKKHRMRLFAAHVGAAYATEFDAFIDLYHSIGDLQDIIKSPKTARLPADPSTRYATCSGLARMATKATFANVVEYVKRLNHRESEALVVHDATSRDAALKNTTVYGAWAVENQDLTIQ